MLTPPPARRDGPLLVAIALVVVAAGIAVWALVALVSANGDVSDAERAAAEAEDRLAELRADDDLVAAGVRDEVAKAARNAIAVMNTMDYREVDAGLAEWADVTTGDLHEEITGIDLPSLANAKSISEGTVVSVAVRELDPGAGTATVLAAVKVSVSTRGQEATDRHQRMEATLRRTDEGWKLDGIAQVPYVEPGS